MMKTKEENEKGGIFGDCNSDATVETMQSKHPVKGGSEVCKMHQKEEME